MSQSVSNKVPLGEGQIREVYLTELGHCRVAAGLGAAVLAEGRSAGLSGAVLELNLELVLEPFLR